MSFFIGLLYTCDIVFSYICKGEAVGKSKKGGRGGGERNNARPNGKAWKKFIKVYDPEKERLVRVPNKR